MMRSCNDRSSYAYGFGADKSVEEAEGLEVVHYTSLISIWFICEKRFLELELKGVLELGFRILSPSHKNGFCWFIFPFRSLTYQIIKLYYITG